ncbi:MAG: ribosomal-protein-alanine N-acetyltransferase [Chitinivibrionales bacterium]|nr:ribosomal-protein-alanine N-acetyltransferase [Chitinivibrionales bacterium]
MTIHKALIRDGSAGDLDELVRLEQACFGDPWSREQLEGELNNTSCRCVVAYHHGSRLLGYCFYGLAADICEIHSIAVDPQCRRQGLGVMLVEHVLAQVLGRVGQVWLDVRRGNVAARALYARCGFEEAGVRRRYYGDGEDAVLMSRRLEYTESEGC